MKYLAYTIYVITVLLISGFARANAMTIEALAKASYEMPVAISEVALNENAAELYVSGSLPNPCYGNPAALLVQDSHDPNVLVVRLSSPIPMSACVARVKYFDTSVTLSMLVHASRVSIDKKAIYVLKVDGSDFEMQIAGSDLLN